MQFIFHCEKYETLNEVEHFRPKAKVGDSAGNVEHWYWFLAFNPTNYRLSSQLSNRPNSNAVLGETGGKGNRFPLCPGSTRATDVAGIDSTFWSTARSLWLDII